MQVPENYLAPQAAGPATCSEYRMGQLPSLLYLIMLSKGLQFCRLRMFQNVSRLKGGASHRTSREAPTSGCKPISFLHVEIEAI